VDNQSPQTDILLSRWWHIYTDRSGQSMYKINYGINSPCWSFCGTSWLRPT